MINIGFIGFGTVLRATYEIMNERYNHIKDFIGDDFSIRKVVIRDPKKYEDIKEIITTDIDDILKDDDIDIIFEATGQVEEIVDHVEQLLSKGKHVITANKALLSKHFERLNDACSNDTKLKFEAAVAAALPIINQLDRIIALNDVNQIDAVLNGTCNYILSKMEAGLSYEQALKQAQELGYAESDPSADVDGFDTMRKLRILATIIFQEKIAEKDIECTGISNLSSQDIEEASKANKRFKLMARACKGGPYRVGLDMINKDDLFAGLIDGENAIRLRTSNARDITFKGMGAGGRETAFAMLIDFLEIYKRS